MSEGEAQSWVSSWLLEMNPRREASYAAGTEGEQEDAKNVALYQVKRTAGAQAGATNMVE